MISFEDIEIGQSASLKRTFSEEDLILFSTLSMDVNPVHLDEVFAATTPFKQRIVHGFLYASLISGVLGTKLPGPGAIYLSQEMKFLRPVYLEEEVKATVTVLEKDALKKTVVFETICTKASGKMVLSGRAIIKC